MIKWFKKHFIPHDGNDHQPHFLRTKNLQLLIVAVFIIQLGVLVLPYMAKFTPTKNFMASVLPAVLDDLTNQNRQNAHLAVLTVSPELNRVAELKAQDMAAKSYFAHVSPEGRNPWYWFDKVGYKYEYAGENLAVDFTDSADIAIAWMNSPTHKANIVKNAYTEIGTGVATGTYQGNPTIFVAQVFGKPIIENPLDGTATVVKISKISGTTTALKVENRISDKPSASKVLGIEIKASSSTMDSLDTTPAKPYVKAVIITKIASSPRHILNIILGILGALVLLALCLKLFIRMDKRHPILITNGLIILILIFTVYIVNNYVARNRIETSSSFMGFDASNSK